MIRPVIPEDLAPHGWHPGQVISLADLGLTLPSYREALRKRNRPVKRANKLGFDNSEGVRGVVWRIADDFQRGRFDAPGVVPFVSAVFADLTNITNLSRRTSEHGDRVSDVVIQAFGEAMQYAMRALEHGLPYEEARALQAYQTSGDEFTFLVPHIADRGPLRF